MAQTTKFTIDANLSGIQLRTQASEMLTALSTLNSGNLEPASPSAGMLWLDTTKNILKIRDKTNTAWLDFAGVNDKVIAASAADSEKLGGLAADKFAKKEDIPAAPQAATETKAGIVKLKNSITGNLSDTAVSEKAAKEYMDKNASIGIDQTWQDVTSERHTGVTYTNTTGRPIFISVWMNANVAGGTSAIEIFVDDKFISGQYAGRMNGVTVNLSACAVVPAGSTYSAKTSRTVDGSYQDASGWLELR